MTSTATTRGLVFIIRLIMMLILLRLLNCVMYTSYMLCMYQDYTCIYFKDILNMLVCKMSSRRENSGQRPNKERLTFSSLRQQEGKALLKTLRKTRKFNALLYVMSLYDI